MAKSGFVVEAFFSPKSGNTEEDYEDAWSARETEAGYRIAIADGATESSFSQLWAGLLVQSYTSTEVDGQEFLTHLEDARRVWKDHVGQRKLPWYAEEKAGLGAFAAFLGFSADRRSKRWSAVAIGDCCLFQLDSGRRGLRLVESFPLSRAEDFGFSPYLVGTSLEKSAEVAEHIKTFSGTMRPDDVFFFASDAVSAWLLKRMEERLPAWETMADLDSQIQFQALVDAAREYGELHNDDSTLVRLTFHG